jgi:hypothetical protein
MRQPQDETDTLPRRPMTHALTLEENGVRRTIRGTFAVHAVGWG